MCNLLKLKLPLFLCCLVTQVFAINQDSLKVEELGRASLNLVYSYPDSAKANIEEGFEVCKSMDSKHLLSLMNNYLGIYYDVTGNYDSAMLSYRKAVTYGMEGEVPQNTAGALNNIGLLFWNNHKYDSAVFYYYKALDIYENIGSFKGQSNVLSNIGLIYSNQRRVKESINSFRKCLRIKQKLKDSLGIGKTYANMGMAYGMGIYTDSSLYFKRLAEPFLISSGNKYELATLYHDFGVSLHMEDQYKEAINYGEKALAIRRELGSKKYIASTLNLLGGLYQKTKQYENGHLVLDEAITIYEKYKVIRQLKGCYHRKAMLFRDQGRFKEAIPYFEKNIETYEEVYDEDRIAKLIKIEEQYENVKAKSQILQQEKELLEKEKKSSRMSVGLILLAIATLGIFLFFRNRIRKNKEKKKKELLEQKLEISRELHDNIGSQLTYLNNGIERAVKNKDTAKLEEISSFSKSTIGDLRTAVWGLNKELTVNDLGTKIGDEIAKVKLSSENEIIFMNDNSENVLSSLIAINVFRIVQEALQNAVKYSKAELLHISLRYNGESLSVNVKDNGEGFEMKDYKGFGLKSMQQRADKVGATLDITSTVGLGTEVSVKLNTANDV